MSKRVAQKIGAKTDQTMLEPTILKTTLREESGKHSRKEQAPANEEAILGAEAAMADVEAEEAEANGITGTKSLITKFELSK